VFVLKMSEFGPFSVVCGIKLSGGKKLNTLPELKMSWTCQRPGFRIRSHPTWHGTPRDAYTHDHCSRNFPSLNSLLAAKSAPCFRIQQYRRHGRLHVAAFP